MKKSIVFIIALLSLNIQKVYAASYQGFISNVSIYAGKAYVVVSGGAYDGMKSNCGSDQMVYSFDPNTNIGKSMLAIALSAKISGKAAYLIGDGTCVGGSIYANQGYSESLIGIDLKGQ